MLEKNPDRPVSESELVSHSELTGGERVSKLSINKAIVREYYFTAAEGVDGSDLTRVREANRDTMATFIPLSKDHPIEGTELEPLCYLTFCVLVLWNGYTVVGQSACADPGNYDKNIGQRLARDDAVGKVWSLLGYELKSKLARHNAMLDEAAVRPSPGHTYVGTKLVNAIPMNRAGYNRLRGWELPSNENGADEGYLVEYTDRVESPPHVEGFQGYVSWSPKDVFERTYKPIRRT